MEVRKIQEKRQKHVKKKSGDINAFFKELKKDYNLYLMLLPGIILLFIFRYMPIYGMKIAFMDYDIVRGFDSSPWVGFEHFVDFVKDPYFFRVLKNTLLLGVQTMIWGFFPPIIFALALNEVSNLRVKKFSQTVSYLPHFIAIVVVVGMLKELFGATGIVNQILTNSGNETKAFFTDSSWFRPLYIGSNVWQTLGWSSIIYVATLAGIDPQLYEAATVDGANRFQKIWHISVPGIMPVAIILLILSSRSIINIGFEKAYLMQSPAIYETSDVIQTYVYRRGLIEQDFSYSSAVGLFNNVIAFIILVVTNRIAKMNQQSSLW